MSLQFLADDNFNRDIVRGLLCERPELFIIYAQEMENTGATNASVLETAARFRQILLTHDRESLADHAYERVRHEERMPGVLVVPQTYLAGEAVVGILLAIDNSEEGEWEGQVRYLPL